MANKFLSDLAGTALNFFQIGIGAAALRLKAVSGKIRARNPGDTADVPLVGSVLAASGDDIQLNEDAAGSGADWLYTLRRPSSGMSGPVVLTLPPDNGSPSQVLSTDGSGVLSWITVAGGNDKPVVDTTTLAFGASSPLAMFTLPANAVVRKVSVVIDTAFNGAPSLSVGITGQTSKYLGSTQVDLTAAAGTVFEVDPGVAPSGSPENLIATYAAGGATQGSARILVEYVIPS